MARDDEAKRLTIDDIKPDIRQVEVINWPGTDRQVGLMQLNCAELQEAHFAARELFDKKGRQVDLFSQEELEAEEMLQQCMLMLVDPEAKVARYRVFKDPAEARQQLSAHERAFFCQMHTELFTPEWAQVNEEE